MRPTNTALFEKIESWPLVLLLSALCFPALISSCQKNKSEIPKIGPPPGFEWISLNMGLDELKSKVPSLKQPKRGLPMFEQRHGLPELYNMATYLFDGGRLVRALIFVDPKKSSVSRFEELSAELKKRFHREADKQGKKGGSIADTWCDKNACLGVYMLPVPIRGIQHDHVYLVYETAERFAHRIGKIKIFDLTGKIPPPPQRQSTQNN
ncbi:MAG: hypothetical protein GXP49_00960 [Deltaproteobacteria bacterium]|nr:hypothetical protein [Deltaproteobacteria bacterium]